jgi:hypothetical protein
MTTTIVPCSTNIGMHGSSFKKQIFIEIVKANKSHNDEIMFLIFKRPQHVDFENYQVN